jgi:hypothetical protein
MKVAEAEREHCCQGSFATGSWVSASAPGLGNAMSNASSKTIKQWTEL